MRLTQEGGIMMKRIMLSVAMVMAFGVAQAEDEVTVVESTVGLTGAFVPGGFDSQSEVFVVVSGMFPNSCYAWSRAEVSMGENNTIDIQAKANITQGVLCYRFLQPYQKEVQIGQLSPGRYTLRFANGDGTYFQEPLVIN